METNEDGVTDGADLAILLANWPRFAVRSPDSDATAMTDRHSTLPCD